VRFPLVALPHFALVRALPLLHADRQLSFQASFFLHGSCPPRDLHSFPTRRSSDLGAARPRRFRRRRSRPPVAAGGHAATGGRERDRKSTRLNSSHQIISYAVFCLKKKNKNINTYYSGAVPTHNIEKKRQP